MKNSKKHLIGLAILPALLSACVAQTPGAGQDSVRLKYYNGYNLNLVGPYLMEELHKLCFDKHTKWVRYSDVNDYLSETSLHGSTDRIPSVATGTRGGYNQMFYSGKTASSGTREHVWPCAKSANLWVHNGSTNKGSNNVDYQTGYIGGGSDLFHIRPCNTSLNTARGDSKFVDFDDYDETENYTTLKAEDVANVVSVNYDSGPYNLKISGAELKGSKYEYASFAEPADEMKGDVARILVYVFIHYSDFSNHPSSKDYMTGQLKFTDVLGYVDEEECYYTLSQWNKLDPVSEVEKNRNNVVQSVQGNRNPFIDYPDLIDKCFSL